MENRFANNGLLIPTAQQEVLVERCEPRRVAAALQLRESVRMAGRAR